MYSPLKDSVIARPAAVVALLILVAGAGGFAHAGADVEGTADTASATAVQQPAARAPVRTHVETSLAPRAQILAKGLQLDAHQQAELVKILEEQRAAVRKIWSNPALLPAERAPATRALEEHTADRIRAMLTDEQKQKYNVTQPAPAPAADNNLTVDQWLEKTRSH